MKNAKRSIERSKWRFSFDASFNIKYISFEAQVNLNSEISKRQN